ncbi:MAG: hypothetical protein GY720_06335 [bacterium]|nr:hypothetical protein [bacterium]
MRLQRPQAFAGFLIVGLIALVGFAAFSATGFRTAPPVDLPDEVTARVAGAILGLDLGPDSEAPDVASPTHSAGSPTATTPAEAQPDSSPETPPSTTPQPPDS